MSITDFASALQGGGAGGSPGPPGPDGSGLTLASGPPDTGTPPDTGSPIDQGQSPDDGSQGGELFDNSMEALDVAEEALQAFIRLDPDDMDRATAGKALTIVLGLKGGHQKSVQAGDAKSLSRALSGSSSIGVPGGAGY